MITTPTTFALYFGNRGIFPASLIASARAEMVDALAKLGHQALLLDAQLTRHGAVETAREGRVYADFLRAHQGEFGGVILCLPNFGDENGAAVALRDAGVPILIQAYPDEMDKLGTAQRRDAFCGKFSIMDVFCQHGLPFTAQVPHVAHPLSSRFAENVRYFDRLCRVVRGMRRLTVGVIGAGVTAFKTVRADEVTLQRHGITVETMDLTDIFARIGAYADDDAKVVAKAETLRAYCSFTSVPGRQFLTLAKLSVVLDDVIEEYGMDTLAVRCWQEIQSQLDISPCVLLGELNDRGIAAACETDIGSALAMRALALTSGRPAACLDWNNNYGNDDNKCILFHCGPVPQSLMAAPGQVVANGMLENTFGPDHAYGCNVGRIAPGTMTFGGLLTEGGKVKSYFGEGKFTEDLIPAEFFGCAGVAEIPNLQHTLQTIGYLGHRHHVSVTPGHVLAPVQEAFEKYLGYEVVGVGKYEI